MSECFCDYDPATFYSRREPKARKLHQCEECGRAIQAGEQYEKVVGKWDGDVSTFKTCSRCTALRDHIKAHVPCFCWAHGNLLQDCRDEVSHLPAAADGTGLYFEIGRLAVAIRRAPSFHRLPAAAFAKATPEAA